MIKIILASTLVLFSFAHTVLADDGGHTATICSEKNADVCAHLGHMSALSSSNAVEFVAHFMTPENQQISDFKIILWMPDMGHGSSPVEVSQFGVNKYQVTKAYFVMPGQWLVKLFFNLDQVAHEISIPVSVAE